MRFFFSKNRGIYFLLPVLFFYQFQIKNDFEDQKIIVGAEITEKYLPFLERKQVAIVANHTSLIKKTHLVDSLLSLKVDLKKIFNPEHGFRGNAAPGEYLKNFVDPKTGLPVISLYGNNNKPKTDDLLDIDIVIFDIQDVGVRFYTYISTMHYVMEACAENGKKLIILDRPNPNGDYVDGPILDMAFESFVGMHPIPVVHGLTIGELAQMINGEGWLKNAIQCDLEIVKIQNYSHSILYSLPVKPSPNLPNDLSVRLYPSLCFFEATEISVGRGTYHPFQVIGYPDKRFGDFCFIPQSIDGMAPHPVQQDKECFGLDLRDENPDSQFTLKYLIDFYNKSNFKDTFFASGRWMSSLSGTDKLQKQIEAGLTENEIRESWAEQLNQYKEMRKKYLLYEDFE